VPTVLTTTEGLACAGGGAACPLNAFEAFVAPVFPSGLACVEYMLRTTGTWIMRRTTFGGTLWNFAGAACFCIGGRGAGTWSFGTFSRGKFAAGSDNVGSGVIGPDAAGWRKTAMSGRKYTETSAARPIPANQ
jgi:hypothetical protein